MTWESLVTFPAVCQCRIAKSGAEKSHRAGGRNEREVKRIRCSKCAVREREGWGWVGSEKGAFDVDGCAQTNRKHERKESDALKIER